MYFEFYQWEPKPGVHHHDDAYAKAMRGDDADQLLSLWMRWRKDFSSALKLVTLTSGREFGDPPSLQLRFWFGEPASIRRGYVDSCGHNLIVHINAPASDLPLYRLLRDHMVGDLPFTREEMDGVEVWRFA